MRRNETRVRVRYKETDAMGIAYYANYFVWFELGRTEWIRALGLSYRDLEKSGLYLPAIKAACEYKAPAHYDDELTIITLFDSMRAVRISFIYEVRCREQLLARGGTEHAFVNAQGRPVALRKINPFLWKKLCLLLEERKGG